MGYHLVTFQCLHFKLVSQHPYNFHEEDDYSIEGLLSTPTDSQRHSNSRCDAAECEDISGVEWAKRVNEAVAKSKTYFSLAVNRYLDMGFRYHNIAMGCRVLTLRDPTCQFAHQQFGTEICAWDDDDFFECWQNTLDKLHDLACERLVSMDEDSGIQMAKALHKIRVAVNGIVGRMLELEEGVRRMDGLQEDLKQTELWSEIVAKPSTKRGRTGRRDTRALRGPVSPGDVFARAAFKAWEGRIAGLWEAFYMT
ncbi:hypothetical protein CBER1_02954 [Cercospora berteroae]|uniref:Uncharacterized protein n=1 Tax=Cercospora berteroae TaxID=357750 RepID=A0A2S6C2L9_9PEZI|nr:hypothetical protein CBER1_02954 [Cercospora berteroae]